MSGIVIHLAAGYISAFYFVVLDLFLLSLIDTVFARVACHLYYRRINAELPISVRSADIPGVTSNLIGRFYSRVNVAVYILKFILLGCVFYVDLGITEFTPASKTVRTGTFVFNASDKAWKAGFSRSVQRRHSFVQKCQIRKGEAIQFYNVAFNLSHGLVLDDEVVANGRATLHELNDTTLQCLSPNFVSEKYTSPGMSVIGCSQLERTACLNRTIINTSVNLNDFVPHGKRITNVVESRRNFNYKGLILDSATLFEIFPAYATASNQSEMTCISTFVGPSKQSSANFTNCLLVLYNGSTTIIEQWEYNDRENKLFRYFPGPVFNGTVVLAFRKRLNQLGVGRNRETWLSLSAKIVADSMVYQHRDQTFEWYDSQLENTEVSWETFILTATLLVVGIVARFVVAFTLGRDKRPQLNTIDGLSSVAREEFLPSGQSHVAGPPMSFGWSQKGQSLARLGPVLSACQSLKRPATQKVSNG